MEMARRKFRLGWFGMLFLASVMMFGCGGGGGDDDGGGGTPAPTVPETLNYGVSAQWYSPTDLLRSTLSGDPPLAFVLTSINLQGTYNRITQATTLQNNTSMGFTVTPNPFTGEGTLTLGVLIPNGTTVRWVDGNDPTEGAFWLTVATPGLGFNEVRVTVNANAGGQGIAGVDIVALSELTPVANVSLSWAEFDAVEDDDEAPLYQKVAVLGYSGWQFVYRFVSLAYTSLEKTVTNDTTIESSGSITLNGDTFPAAGPATLQITWLDDGNGTLGPNDDFDCLFTDWWVDTPGDIDNLYNGTLQLTGYTETSAPNVIGGDFVFNNFTEEETQGGAILTDDMLTVNGGFNFTLTW